MNQPTEDRFKQFEERQAEIEKRLIRVERQTEPIHITRLEIDSGSIFRRLDEIEENTNVTKIQMEGVSGNLLQIRESQADLRDRLIEHSEDLKIIKENQDTHTEILGQLMNFGERIEATMATKDGISALKATQDEHSERFDRLEATQNRQEQLLQEILNRLPPKQ